MGSIVPLSLQSSDCASNLIANKSAVVWILENGIIRTLSASTGPSGSATVDFVPLPTEAGFYQVAAALPGLPMPGAQGSFTLAGMSLNTNHISAKVTPGVPLTNRITLSNLTSVALTGLSATVVGDAADVTAQLSVPPVLPGGATGQFTCVLNGAGLC